jgi:hypothetical protein
MITLEDEKELIMNFIVNSIQEFKTQKGEFNSIGIYCCPWAGWITSSFNFQKSLSDTFNNCPDFDFVGFRFLELPKWEEEYEGDAPTYQFKGNTITYNYELGDEVLNELFFIFLSTILLEVKSKLKEDILLQMLDSKFYKVL